MTSPTDSFSKTLPSATRFRRASTARLTIVDTVRWAGLQENSQHLHYDRDHVREHNGLKTFIASGAYRQALLMRMLTDWIGPHGRLSKISVRHTYSTFEGDLMRFGAKIVEKSTDPSESFVICDLAGVNQENRQILTGRCTLILSRDFSQRRSG